ncbi:MAG: OmpA family protein [Methylococcaceae bacterium]
MKKNSIVPLTLIAVAIVSGCNSMPHNSSLDDAHSRYSNAQSSPEVTNLAALELKEAGDTLNKADSALNKRESDDKVNQLAYIAAQQVGIAQETAKRKTAELAIANAEAKRNEVRLEARTAEADAAKDQALMNQETIDWQSTQLAVASANTERDLALIAEQEMQLQALNAKKTERGMVITLGDVLFSTDQAQLKSGGMRNVQKLAGFLTQYPQQKVLVEGYTDSTGSDSYNQDLSDRRAYAVRAALMDAGISSDRVATHGYGEAYPVAGNDTAASRQLNRRVEIILSDNNGHIAPR